MKEKLREWGPAALAAALLAYVAWGWRNPPPHAVVPDGVAVVHSGGEVVLKDHDHLDARECKGCDERVFLIAREAALTVLGDLGKVRGSKRADGSVGVAWVGS